MEVLPGPQQRIGRLEDEESLDALDDDYKPARGCACKRRRGMYAVSLPFSWAGNLLVGPHWPMLVFTYALIVGPSVALWVSKFPLISPFLVILGLFFFVGTVGCLTYTGFVDAGIVTKSMKFPNAKRLQYCPECDLYRPRHAMHCDDCGFCVLHMDHHCPWMGKCIGKHTTRSFYGFLTFLVFLMVYTIVVGLGTRDPNEPAPFPRGAVAASTRAV